MKEYIISIVLVSLICSIVKIISPGGEGEGLSRHIKLVCGLCIICVIINPLLGAVEWLKNFDFSAISDVSGTEDKYEEYESIFSGYLTLSQSDYIKTQIKDMLQKEFDIDPSDVDVMLYIKEENGEKKLERVTLLLHSKAALKDPVEIEEHVSGMTACEVVVAVG